MAQKYGECKTSFNEIITTVRNLIANRVQLMEYEKRTNKELGHAFEESSEIVFTNKLSNCYGCAVNGAENAVLLLRALSTLNPVRESLIESNMVLKLLEAPLSLGSAKLRSLVRRALCRLVRGSEKASAQLGNELRQRIIHTAIQNQRNPQLAGLVRNDLELLKETLKHKDIGWETRLKAALGPFSYNHFGLVANQPIIMHQFENFSKLFLWRRQIFVKIRTREYPLSMGSCYHVCK